MTKSKEAAFAPPFKSNLKTLVIIDGVHFNYLARAHNMYIEFSTFRDLLSQSPLLGSPRYYTAVRMLQNGEPKNNVSGLLTWLGFHGYMPIQKNIYQTSVSDKEDSSYTPSHIYIMMSLDILTLYNEQGFNRLLLVSGSKDLLPIVQRMREFGVQVDVISSFELDTISQDLRSNCDNFYEFTSISHLFFKDKEQIEN